MSAALPLYVKLELRAITNSDLKRDSAVMMSSTMPSAKYSCSGSPDMFWNGSTAIEGLSGSARGWTVSTFCRHCRRRRVRINSTTPRAHRLGNILQRLQTHIVEGNIDFAADLALGVIGDADASGFRDPFQTRGDVDAIAKNIVVVDDDVADVNADAEFDPDILR